MQWTSNQLLIFLKEKEIMGKHASLTSLNAVDEMSSIFYSNRGLMNLKKIHVIKFLIKTKLEDGKVKIIFRDLVNGGDKYEH